MSTGHACDCCGRATTGTCARHAWAGALDLSDPVDRDMARTLRAVRRERWGRLLAFCGASLAVTSGVWWLIETSRFGSGQLSVLGTTGLLVSCVPVVICSLSERSRRPWGHGSSSEL